MFWNPALAGSIAICFHYSLVLQPAQSRSCLCTISAKVLIIDILGALPELQRTQNNGLCPKIEGLKAVVIGYSGGIGALAAAPISTKPPANAFLNISILDCMYTYICVHIRTYIHTHTFYMYRYKRTYIYIDIYTHVYIHKSVYTYMYVIHIYVYMYGSVSKTSGL